MSFDIPLNLLVVLLPPVCMGILLAGVFLFTYMYVVNRNPLYGSILFAGILALGFVGSETFLMYIGNIRLNDNLGHIFHLTEQLSGLFYLAALPFLLQQFLELSPQWKSFNRKLVKISFLICVFILISAIIEPDLFISITKHQSTWKTNQANFARGKEGILYLLRDLLLGLYIIYSFIVIILDMTRRNDREHLIYLAAGLLFPFLGGINDTIYVYFRFNIDFIQLEYSRFSIGITLMIILMMTGEMKEFILSAKKLKILHSKLITSENRYRCLFNGTDDLIMTSDINFNLISANTAARKQLGINLAEHTELNIFKFFECGQKKDNVAFQILKEKLENFLNGSASVSFKAMLLDKYREHAYEYNMRFEKIELDNRTEIIIHAARTNVRAISEYITSETMHLVMDNQVLNVEEICSRLTVNLSRFMEPQQINTIKIGLREMIINAIEHGNLRISFEDKSKLTLSDQYVAHIIDLQKTPEFLGKYIQIEYSLKQNSVEYRITDDGDGFDYKDILNRLNEKNETEMFAHGRGLIMTMNIFDEVLFNDKGNSVTLIKNFG